MAHVYILYSQTIDTFYVGSTGNLEDRMIRHNAGRCKYTKRGIPWTLVYAKEYATKAEACREEYRIKAEKSRKYIEQLVQRYMQSRQEHLQLV